MYLSCWVVPLPAMSNAYNCVDIGSGSRSVTSLGGGAKLTKVF